MNSFNRSPNKIYPDSLFGEAVSFTLGKSLELIAEKYTCLSNGISPPKEDFRKLYLQDNKNKQILLESAKEFVNHDTFSQHACDKIKKAAKILKNEANIALKSAVAKSNQISTSSTLMQDASIPIDHICISWSSSAHNRCKNIGKAKPSSRMQPHKKRKHENEDCPPSQLKSERTGNAKSKSLSLLHKRSHNLRSGKFHRRRIQKCHKAQEGQDEASLHKEDLHSIVDGSDSKNLRSNNLKVIPSKWLNCEETSKESYFNQCSVNPETISFRSPNSRETMDCGNFTFKHCSVELDDISKTHVLGSSANVPSCEPKAINKDVTLCKYITPLTSRQTHCQNSLEVNCHMKEFLPKEFFVILTKDLVTIKISEKELSHLELDRYNPLYVLGPKCPWVPCKSTSSTCRNTYKKDKQILNKASNILGESNLARSTLSIQDDSPTLFNQPSGSKQSNNSPAKNRVLHSQLKEPVLDDNNLNNQQSCNKQRGILHTKKRVLRSQLKEPLMDDNNLLNQPSGSKQSVSPSKKRVLRSRLKEPLMDDKLLNQPSGSKQSNVSPSKKRVLFSQLKEPMMDDHNLNKTLRECNGAMVCIPSNSLPFCEPFTTKDQNEFGFSDFHSSSRVSNLSTSTAPPIPLSEVNGSIDPTSFQKKLSTTSHGRTCSAPSHKRSSTPSHKRVSSPLSLKKTSSTPSHGRTSFPPSHKKTSSTSSHGRTNSVPSHKGTSSTPSHKGASSTPSHKGTSSTPSYGRTSSAPSDKKSSTPSHGRTSSAPSHKRTSSTPSHVKASSPSHKRTSSTPSHGKASSPLSHKRTHSTPSHIRNCTPSHGRASSAQSHKRTIFTLSPKRGSVASQAEEIEDCNEGDHGLKCNALRRSCKTTKTTKGCASQDLRLSPVATLRKTSNKKYHLRALSESMPIIPLTNCVKLSNFNNCINPTASNNSRSVTQQLSIDSSVNLDVHPKTLKRSKGKASFPSADSRLISPSFSKAALISPPKTFVSKSQNKLSSFYSESISSIGTKTHIRKLDFTEKSKHFSFLKSMMNKENISDSDLQISQLNLRSSLSRVRNTVSFDKAKLLKKHKVLEITNEDSQDSGLELWKTADSINSGDLGKSPIPVAQVSYNHSLMTVERNLSIPSCPSRTLNSGDHLKGLPLRHPLVDKKGTVVLPEKHSEGNNEVTLKRNMNLRLKEAGTTSYMPDNIIRTSTSKLLERRDLLVSKNTEDASLNSSNKVLSEKSILLQDVLLMNKKNFLLSLDDKPSNEQLQSDSLKELRNSTLPLDPTRNKNFPFKLAKHQAHIKTQLPNDVPPQSIGSNASQDTNRKELLHTRHSSAFFLESDAAAFKEILKNISMKGIPRNAFRIESSTREENENAPLKVLSAPDDLSAHSLPTSTSYRKFIHLHRKFEVSHRSFEEEQPELNMLQSNASSYVPSSNLSDSEAKENALILKSSPRDDSKKFTASKDNEDYFQPKKKKTDNKNVPLKVQTTFSFSHQHSWRINTSHLDCFKEIGQLLNVSKQRHLP